ncbi:MAG: hypothetical protein FWG40_08425, partial [Peptococcaceae bacterium]|nr:hypothetical protein [Peptococcaceae bacterium]
ETVVNVGGYFETGNGSEKVMIGSYYPSSGNPTYYSVTADFSDGYVSIETSSQYSRFFANAVGWIDFTKR